MIAELARRQHGAVGRQQLLALGFTRRQIDHRVVCGRLHVIHHGVYAVGHVLLTAAGRCMAATLAAGPDSAISHRTGGRLHTVRQDNRTRIELTARRRCVRPGLEVHVSPLPSDEIVEIDGVRVTSLHRTLLDLAGVVPMRQVERAMEEAIRRTLTDIVPMATLLRRHPRHRGTKVIRRILARGRLGRTWTRSELEEAFLAYLDRHALPTPALNRHVAVAGELVECDAVYEAARVVVELDSREWHDNPTAFAHDRFKSRRLTVAGWHPVRVAPEHLDTAELARDLRDLLGRAAE